MATPLLIALGALGAGFGGRFAMQRLAARGGKTGMDAWVKGGFQTKMDPKEAKQILGIRCARSCSPRAGTCGEDQGRLGGQAALGALARAAQVESSHAWRDEGSED